MTTPTTSDPRWLADVRERQERRQRLAEARADLAAARTIGLRRRHATKLARHRNNPSTVIDQQDL